jgi:lipoprotein-anchoring transpeptidase ErfK/SrfK
MPPRGLMSSFAFAALAATASLMVAPQAQAQGLFEFLWGGGQEWGGSKQTVSFDAKYTPGQIIVSFGDRRLYLITKSGQAMSYPIAVPREQSRWQGATTVTDKRMNPSWRPTPEMLRENPKLPLWVPGGHRMNPLGVRAMYLGSSLYRIHGTDAPWTIGQAVSKGCIRMLNEDVQDLYPRVPVGTKVTVTWQRFGSQAVASGDEPEPFNPLASSGSAYKSPGASSRPIRQRTPSADAEVAHNVDPAADDQALAAAAEKPIEPKPVKKAEVHKKHEAAPAAAPTPSHADAVAIAERAAATAARAAEAARAAAEAAKKAAEDAKNAQSGEPDKRAAL